MTTKTNKIDAYNDAEYERAKREGDTHMTLLHATKGYRRVSFKRLEAGVEGVQGMSFKIQQVIARCQV